MIMKSLWRREFFCKSAWKEIFPRIKVIKSGSSTLLLWYATLISSNSLPHDNVQLKQTVSIHSITQTVKTLRHLHSSQNQKWKIKWAQSHHAAEKSPILPAPSMWQFHSVTHRGKEKQLFNMNKHLLVRSWCQNNFWGFFGILCSRQTSHPRGKQEFTSHSAAPITWPPPSFLCGHFPEGQGKSDPFLQAGWWRHRGHTAPTGSPQPDN